MRWLSRCPGGPFRSLGGEAWSGTLASTPRGSELRIGVLAVMLVLLSSSLPLAFSAADHPAVLSPSSIGSAVGSPRGNEIQVPAVPEGLPTPSAPPAPPSLPPPPVVGWPTPRGPATENGSSTGFAPEVPSAGSPPSLLGVAALGRAASNLTGMAVSPGGPLLLALRNGTVGAFGAQDLAPLWTAKAHEPLVAGPTTVGGLVYAMGSSGRLFAWDVGSGVQVWNTSLGAPDLGAAPVPYQGDLFVLTQKNLSVVNGTTGALLFVGGNSSADPTHALAVSGGLLYAQAVGGLDAFTAFGRLWNFTPQFFTHEGAPLFSDGLVAVAGPSGNLSGGLNGPHVWKVRLNSGHAPLLEAAASNGRIYATDGVGPLHALEASSGNSLWETSFYTEGPPTAVGQQVFVGANLTALGDGVAAVNATTGALLWFFETAKPVNSTVVVADGDLYAMDESGNLTALGSPPLQVFASSSPTADAGVGTPFTFTAWTSGGAGSPLQFSWMFSDGAKNVGSSVQHAFSVAGPAWAQVIASDQEGAWAGPFVVNVTVDPALTAKLQLSPSSGPAPFWTNATVTVAGGHAPYSLSLQVQGTQPEWLHPASLNSALNFTLPGTDWVTASVNDTVGDRTLFGPVQVVVTPAAFAPPSVQLVAPTPGALWVLWNAPPEPGFEAWVVNVSIDHGAAMQSVRLAATNASSYLFGGLSMDSQLSVQVARETSFGWFASTPINTTTALVAPTISAAATPGFPGQATLSWSLAVPIDLHQGNATWTVNMSLPGSSAPTSLPASAPVDGIGEFVAPVVPDLASTEFQLYVHTFDAHALSPAVSFAPLLSPPTLQVVGGPLGLHVSWNAASLPEFSSVRVCYSTDLTTWSCPFNDPSPVNTSWVVVPRAGTYDVNVTAVAGNGFAASSTVVVATVLPGTTGAIWYATPLVGVPFWFWAFFVLLVVALFWVGSRLLRERRGIPPYLGEVMPWDPLAPDLEPKARPKDPETLRVAPKIHRHRDSHSHRHPSTSEEDAESSSGQVAVVRLKKPSGAAPTTASRPSRATAAPDEEEGSEEQEAEEGPASPPTKRSGTKGAERPVKIEQVGEETSSADEEEDEEEPGPDELKKLPVVLRHPEPPTEEVEGAHGPRSPPSSRHVAPSSDRETEDEEGPRAPTPKSVPPKRPAPRPKSEDEEPTL
ncbi:MAG: PQQ-binding-like beta-propeller repeat protein [Euryarchaeota archaeon]|nr:PQQ-binding-like beta-propeller repeat protein [Euryarchaeota archaeon]MDE2044195.1 PQQ-binding-like beta-propeller repeat protein [Thermoplasmata archaeon]